MYNGHYRDDLDLKYLLVDNVTNEIRTDYRQHAYSFFHEYMPYFAGYGITPPNTPIPPCKLAELIRNTNIVAGDFTNCRVDIVHTNKNALCKCVWILLLLVVCS